MSAPRVLTLVVLLTLGVPLGAQSQTPRERAEELAQQASAVATNSERARLSFLALAEWYEEGARAVLTLDHDRLEHAARQEWNLLFEAIYALRDCGGDHILTYRHADSLASTLAYVRGAWDGQGGGQQLAGQAHLANLLLDSAAGMRTTSGNCVP